MFPLKVIHRVSSFDSRVKAEGNKDMDPFGLDLNALYCLGECPKNAVSLVWFTNLRPSYIFHTRFYPGDHFTFISAADHHTLTSNKSRKWLFIFISLLTCTHLKRTAFLSLPPAPTFSNTHLTDKNIGELVWDNVSIARTQAIFYTVMVAASYRQLVNNWDSHDNLLLHE